ncbi:MAG: ABC transporter ATP-binding protein [Anaerolineae bacterium]|nr:ABC transporter ATP-binding protein [Anaerolineae bacterium]
MEADIILEVKNLRTYFELDEGTVHAVDGVDFTVKRGITLGIVGESGCGKSVTAMSILKIVDAPGKIVDGQVVLRNNGQITDLVALPEHSPEMRSIRGNAIAMVFQEPMNSLSPVHTIGNQIMEAVMLHNDVTKAQARERVIELLGLVGIPNPEQRIDNYTFQLSGGMRQRAMIAMALSCNPALLIADEPTTALDVTTQAQILELMKSLQVQFGMAVMLITHDLGVVAETCDEVVVMYLGEVVEQADIDSLFYDPKHPYTQALMRSIPRLGAGRTQQLNPIEGTVPDPFSRPSGCPFHSRCDQFMAGKCDVIHPKLTTLEDGRTVRCLLYEDV